MLSATARSASTCAGLAVLRIVRIASAFSMWSNTPSLPSSIVHPPAGSAARIMSGSARTYCFSPRLPNARETARKREGSARASVGEIGAALEESAGVSEGGSSGWV